MATEPVDTKGEKQQTIPTWTRQLGGGARAPAHLLHQEADVVALDGAAVHGGAGVDSLHHCNGGGA